MSDITNITMERKLELMREIRSRNEKDRFDMARREQIVYGRTAENTIHQPLSYDVANDMEDEVEFQTFPLRILLSVALFLLIVMCDLSGKSFLGISAGQCFQAIERDYESSISAWIDAASENVVSENIEENPPTGSRP